MKDRHQCLEELRYARRQDRPALFETPSSTIIRGANQWVDETRYFGVPLINASPGRNISIRREKTAQRLGMQGLLLNKRSGLSIRNGVLLYEQLIRHACAVWRSAVRSHIRKLQLLQPKCLRIATNAPRYIDNRQIHDDLRVPYFSDHIRTLRGSTRS